jgi:anthranilate phosphoribosyltransferase
MKVVAPIRKSLGIRTTFNILGPMTNAADASRAVIGVFDESLVDLLAESSMEIGTLDHAVIVNGCGLDEISPLGPSLIYEIYNESPPDQPKKYSTKRYTKLFIYLFIIHFRLFTKS